MEKKKRFSLIKILANISKKQRCQEKFLFYSRLTYWRSNRLSPCWSFINLKKKKGPCCITQSQRTQTTAVHQHKSYNLLTNTNKTSWQNFNLSLSSTTTLMCVDWCWVHSRLHKMGLKVAKMARSIFDAITFLVRVNYSKCKNLISRSFYAIFSSIR